MGPIESIWVQVDGDGGFLCPFCGGDRVQLRSPVQRGRCWHCHMAFTQETTAPRFHKTEPPPFDMRKMRIRFSAVGMVSEEEAVWYP